MSYSPVSANSPACSTGIFGSYPFDSVNLTTSKSLLFKKRHIPFIFLYIHQALHRAFPLNGIYQCAIFIRDLKDFSADRTTWNRASTASPLILSVPYTGSLNSAALMCCKSKRNIPEIFCTFFGKVSLSSLPKRTKVEFYVCIAHIPEKREG